MQVERHYGAGGIKSFVGKDDNGEDMFYYPEDDVMCMLRESGARSYLLDLMKRILFFGDREDFHRFMFTCGFADSRQENGEVLVDDEGVIIPNIPQENLELLRKPDSSSYGQPWQVYSVFFQMGIRHPWEVRANHRVARAEENHRVE